VTMRLLLCMAVLLTASAGPAAEQKDAARPIFPRKGLPKGGVPRARQIGPPLSNPGSPVARLYRATQEERERALEKLPPRMQEQFRQQLARFDAMPKPQQEVMIRRAERFAALSPEQRAAFVQHMDALRKVAEDRRREIGLAIRKMQPLTEDERQTLVASDAFKSRFSADEQRIIIGLAEVMIPPL
jgi:hypothetical protein